MAKSAGNFVTIKELREGWRGRPWDQSELRLLMLSTHYRQPLDWTLQGLREASQTALEWKQLTANEGHDPGKVTPSNDLLRALLDDLNTPEALYYLHETAKRTRRESSSAKQLYDDLVFLGLFSDRNEEVGREVQTLKSEFPPPVFSHDPTADVLVKQRFEDRVRSFVWNLNATANTATMSSMVVSTFAPYQGGKDPEFMIPWRKYGPPFISTPDMKHIEGSIGIEALNSRIEQRLAARSSKDFRTADLIRDELAAMGVELEDKRDGTTTWKVKR